MQVNRKDKYIIKSINVNAFQNSSAWVRFREMPLLNQRPQFLSRYFDNLFTK